MPAVVPIIINAIVTAVVVTVVDIIVDTVIEAVFGEDEVETRDDMQQQAETAARARALLVNKNSNNAGIPLIYGKYRMGGTRVYLETSNKSGGITDTDANNEYFNCVLSLCEGKMGNIRELYFGDELVWSGNGGGDNGYTLSSFTGSFASALNDNSTIKYYNGSTTQAVDGSMQGSVGSGVWTSSHKLTGIAYLSIILKANAEAYAGGLPVFTAVLEGKSIPDVSNTDDDDTSITYGTASADQNPADCIYDYLINPIYGKGLDHKPDGTYFAGLDIDLASFKQARIDCAAAWGGAGTEFNGTLSTEQKLYENVQRMTKACNGLLMFSGGKYRLQIQKKDETVPQKDGEDSPSHIFNEDNILGEVTVNRGKKSTKINKVTSGFTDAALTPKYIDNIVVTKDSDALDDDNGTVLEASMDHQLTTNSAFVTRLNEYRIDKTRNQTAIVFKASHKALVVECGEIIKVSQDALGWDNKLFRVITITLNADNEVAISAIEYISSIQI